MHKYRKLIPVVAIILVALGVNLEKFGIDLQALTGQGNSSGYSTNSQQTSSSASNSNASNSSSSNKNSQQGGGHQAAGKQWSDSNPEINLWHVFHGEINRKGKPTGYHSRPGGRDAVNARVVSVKSKPNSKGVYTANIEVRDGNQWKSKFSSFFPDNMSQQEVIDAILNAYKKSNNPKKQPWSGPSGYGFQIQGYTTNRGGINTAFPVYVKSQ